MKRRGFVASLLALVAVPALAWGRPKRRFVLPPSVPVGIPEYRWRGRFDYMRVRRTYWRRGPQQWGLREGWCPCTRSEFYRASRYPGRFVPWVNPRPTAPTRLLDELRKRAGVR
jgi:hypothetical protein